MEEISLRLMLKASTFDKFKVCDFISAYCLVDMYLCAKPEMLPAAEETLDFLLFDC